MTWTINDERAIPFLSADGRRDVAAVLWRMPMVGLVSREEMVDTGKEGSKDSKDGKDSKDSKDSMEFKGDGSDFVFVSTDESRQFADQRSDPGTNTGGEVADVDDDVVMVLRNSRVNRYLRRAGLVI